MSFTHKKRDENPKRRRNETLLPNSVGFLNLLSEPRPEATGKSLASFPAIHEQRAVAEPLSDVDAEIAALEQRRDKTRALKPGMIQELLTGRTRLV